MLLKALSNLGSNRRPVRQLPDRQRPVGRPSGILLPPQDTVGQAGRDLVVVVPQGG